MIDKSYGDQLREMAQRDTYHEQLERTISAEVNTVLYGIKELSRSAASVGQRNICGYFDTFYWDGTDYFVQPDMSRTGLQRHVLPGSDPRPIGANLQPILQKRYSQAEIAYIHQEIVNRLAAKCIECGFSNVSFRVDKIAQTTERKYFARKTGGTLYYLWMNVSW